MLEGDCIGIELSQYRGLPDEAVGFRLTSDAWERWRVGGIDALRGDLRSAVATVEERIGGRLGSGPNGIVLDVAADVIVAPGVPCRVTHVGMTRDLVYQLDVIVGRAAVNAMVVRFMQTYAEVVEGIPNLAQGLHAVEPITLHQRTLELTGRLPAADPFKQFEMSVSALFASANCSRALTHRRRVGMASGPAPVTLTVVASTARKLAEVPVTRIGQPTA